MAFFTSKCDKVRAECNSGLQYQRLTLSSKKNVTDMSAPSNICEVMGMLDWYKLYKPIFSYPIRSG